MATLRIPRTRGKLAPIDHKILKQKSVTPKGMQRYMNALLAAFAPHLVPEALGKLREGIKVGDIRSIETTLKTFGLTNAPGMSINVNQNNVNNPPEDAPRHMSFETIMRERTSDPVKVIDVTPVEQRGLPCPPNSVKTSNQDRVGSATQASQS